MVTTDCENAVPIRRPWWRTHSHQLAHVDSDRGLDRGHHRNPVSPGIHWPATTSPALRPSPNWTKTTSGRSHGAENAIAWRSSAGKCRSRSETRSRSIWWRQSANGRKIIAFAFSPKDDVVAYSENDQSRTAKILDTGTGATITLDAGADQPDVVFSPDGALLATGGYAAEVRLWSVANGQLVRRLDVGPALGGLTPEFSPDGRVLAVGHRNSTTFLFETATGKLLCALTKMMSQEIQFHPDSQMLAVAYVDGSVAIWRVTDCKLLAERKTQADELYTVDWSPDGRLLATAGLKGKISLWDPRDLSLVRELPAPEWVVRVKFSPDGLSLHYAGGVAAPGGKRHLGVLGVEGSLYSLLNRPIR